MSNEILIFLKSRQVTFNKTEFKNHLKSIKDKAKSHPKGQVIDSDDILDLCDFIQDYCDKSERLQEIFDLDNCDFVVKKSPRYSTKCLYIVDRETKNEEQISTNNFGNPPPAIVNFRSFCSFVIRNFKLDYRKRISKAYGIDYQDYDLWHESPTTKQIVNEFVQLKDIGNKLDLVISPNGSGSNVPYLLKGYEHLKNEFIEFYQQKAQKQINFDLKSRP